MEPQCTQTDHAEEQILLLTPVNEEFVNKNIKTPRPAIKPQFIQTEYSGGQLVMLPRSIEDLVKEDAPVRILSSILEMLGIVNLRDDCKGGGRPSYDPVVLTRILVFGLTKGLRSSRALAELTANHAHYMFLAYGAQPDFRTIARFRANNEGRIQYLFKQSIKLGSIAGMIDLKHCSVDGTKIEANAAKRKYRSDEELDELIKKAEEVAQTLLADWKRNDEKDENKKRKKKAVRAQQIEQQLKDAKITLADREAKGIVLTDQDSRMMKTKGGIRPGYNAQATVDSNCQMIVAAEVVQDEGDSLQFEPMVEATFKNLEKYPEKVSADGGYWNGEVLEYVNEKKLDAYIAPSGIDPASLKDWTFDETADAYTGTNGDIYIFEKQICKGKRKGKSIIYRTYRCKETGKAKWIQVGTPTYTEMQKKTSTPEGSAVYKWRKAIIEPVFAHIKVAYGFRRMHLRGLSGARTEYMLACLTHNISKLMKNHAMIPSTA